MSAEVQPLPEPGAGGTPAASDNTPSGTTGAKPAAPVQPPALDFKPAAPSKPPALSLKPPALNLKLPGPIKPPSLELKLPTSVKPPALELKLPTTVKPPALDVKPTPPDAPAPEETEVDALAPDEPASEEVASDEPASDEPAADEQAYDEPAADEQASDELAYEEQAYEEQAYEEQAYEEQAPDEQAYEEQASEEPAESEAQTASDEPTRLSAVSGSASFSRQPAPAPATIREGEVLGDRYRVHHRLGKGGMGEVYLAEHIAIGRKVAIKTLNAHLQDKPEIAERFMQEARTSSLVRHSNIVDILDFGHTDHGAPYFVMEYLEGEDLKTVLKRERVLPWDRARDIILQVCAALAAAHAQGVVHRDLKPDNIYLIRQGDQELVKVLDFGIAKIVSDAGDEMTQTGVLLGTPEYMSPEQAQDQPLDGRSDIYAMGVLMFRMFTGRLPFRAKAFMAVLAMHMQQPPPRPSEVDPTRPVSARQEAVILRCLAKNPDERYQSADELAAAIREVDAAGAFDITFELVAAPPPRRLLGPVLAAFGLAAAVGLAVFLLVRPSDSGDMSAKTAQPIVAAPLAPEPSPPEPEATQQTPPPPQDPPASEDSGDPPPPEPDTAKATTKKTRAVKTTKSSAPLAALGDAEIKAATAGLRSALAACEDLGIPGTTYKVDVDVSTDGKVTSATAHKPARGSDLGDCVEKAAAKARFPALESAQRVTLALRL